MVMSPRLISIIIPVYNSKMIMPKLLEVIDTVRREQNWELELVMVDDGSRDQSFEAMKELSLKYPYLRGIRLSRNFGHQAALRTGLTLCQGDYIAIIDDDLQDPPSILPRFFQYLDDGFDVAYGVRQNRKESFVKILAYQYFYKILQLVSEIDIPLNTGDFCVMKKHVVQQMLKLNERNLYLRGIRAWVGFKQIGIEYEREKREFGETGYSFTKLFRLAFDGIFAFSNLPARAVTLTGGTGILVTIFYTIYIVGKFLTFGIPQPGFITLVIMVMFFGSLNLTALGIIGEFTVRIYSESKNRPYAVIAETTDTSPSLGKGDPVK